MLIYVITQQQGPVPMTQEGNLGLIRTLKHLV